MIFNNFLLGACFSLYLCIFVTAYINRSDRVPYREAFAWLGLISALQCLWEVVGHIFPEWEVHNQENLDIFVDSLGVPFVFLEIECICKQDLVALPWRTRWLQLVLSEVPILAIFTISLFTGLQSYKVMMYSWIAIYMVIFTIRMVRNLREYNYLMSYARDTKNHSKNWTIWILIIDMSIVCLYAVLCPYFDNPMIENIYLACNMSLISVNAYFIWTQRPENAKELAMIRAILQQERDIIQNKMQEMERQIEVLSEKESQIDALSTEMTANAEKLKRKASIKEYMDAIRLQHPQFERSLNKVADGRLTNHDVLLCMLIYDGRRVSYIAKMTGVNIKSVEMARSRLRKKLHLAPHDNLNNFIKSIGRG